MPINQQNGSNNLEIPRDQQNQPRYLDICTKTGLRAVNRSNGNKLIQKHLEQPSKHKTTPSTIKFYQEVQKTTRKL